MDVQPLTREESRPETAAVLRRLIEFEAAGTDLDPWLAFPQNACCFSFGDRGLPLPIGALSVLWRLGSPFAQPCPDCRDSVRMVSFGGLLSVGGGRLVCPGCAMGWFQQIGGIGTVAPLISGALAGTPYRVSGTTFGGATGSDGAQLLTTLGLTKQPLEPEMPQVSLQDGTALRFSLAIPEPPSKAKAKR